MNASPSADTAFSNPLPHYVERHGLSAAPFSSIHEDRFVYLDAERLQRLHMLEHLVRYSELLLIITGVKGIGKTSLLQRFLLQTDEDTVASRVDANPMMDANHLLQAIGRGFGLTDMPADPAALQDALYHHLANLHHQEKIPLLVIDDAHVLPQDALEALFNLAEAEASDGNLLRIILFSDPQIETMLQSPAIQGLRERVTHSMDIPPFDEEQTVACIRHRLSVAGLRGALPFSDKELHKIYRNSGGIPARIVECAHLILNGDKLDQAVKDFHTPRLELRKRLKLPALFTRMRPWQLAAAGATALALILVLLYQDRINAFFEPPPAEEAQLTPPPAATPVPEPVAETPALISEPASEPAPAPAPESTPVPLPDMPLPDIQAPKAETGETAVTSEAPPAEPPSPAKTETAAPAEPPAEPAAKTTPAPPPAPVITDISPDPVPASRRPQTLNVLGEHFHEDMQVTVYWKGGHKTLTARQVRILNPNEMELSITVGRQPDEWKLRLRDPRSGQQAEARFRVTAAKKKPATPAKTKAAAAPATKLQGDAWIRRQEPSHFTLQLLGGYRKAGLEQFARRHGLKDAAIFSRLRDGRPWHVLIQGNYPDRARAQKAALHWKDKPARIQPPIQPWIRPFRDIQKLLEKQSVTPPPVSIHQPASLPPAGDATRAAAWIWSQDPSHYTLQLLAGHTESGIRSFIRQHKLGGKAVYYRTTRDGRPWYVLIYQHYPDRKAARAAIASLPESLRKTRPWARSFASIHAELQ